MSMVSGKDKKSVTAENPLVRWGKYYDWKVTAESINTYNNLTVSDDYDTEKKKRQSAKISIEYTMYRELFGKKVPVGKGSSKKDINSHISAWRSRIGKTGAFYLTHKSLFGCKKYKLTAVKASNIVQNNGTVVAVDMSLEFTEVKKSKNQKKTISRKTTKKSSKK